MIAYEIHVRANGNLDGHFAIVVSSATSIPPLPLLCAPFRKKMRGGAINEKQVYF
jgi:hypothetical protein